MLQQPKIALVAALSRNNVIGKDNDLLWRLPADMAHFKQVTAGHAVIMGSKTYLSIPEKFRPLPNRLNIVLSRQNHAQNEDYNPFWTDNLSDALSTAQHDAAEKNQKQIFVIGGGEIYKMALPLADRLYLTHVDADYDGDAFFPDDYKKMEWQENILATHPAEKGQPAFTIIQYDRID